MTRKQTAAIKVQVGSRHVRTFANGAAARRHVERCTSIDRKHGNALVLRITNHQGAFMK